jgi:Zn-dependent alcohol dehydrogenase
MPDMTRENVVVDGINSDLSSTTRANSIDGNRELESRFVDTGEVASAGLAGVPRVLSAKRVDVDAGSRSAGVVLVGLNAVEVATLTLREAVLTVEL